MPPASCAGVAVPEFFKDVSPIGSAPGDLAVVGRFVNGAGGIASDLSAVAYRLGRWVLGPSENLNFLRALAPDDFRASAALSAASDLDRIAAGLSAVSSALKMSAGLAVVV